MEIELSRNTKTDYTIVTPDQPDTGNKFAVQEFGRFLKLATGTEFQTAGFSHTPNSKRIFLGISPAALNILKEDPRKN